MAKVGLAAAVGAAERAFVGVEGKVPSLGCR
ncbi:hypothetical protein T02_4868 [Trichinella nativa]|uniref:Uncharacterized protein n=1 Tax=Trichinella nativa TaxID=6335 RepID=A0A0V1KHR3_9BILA|nr:hypothetical protein T02_4868 [Trichinella nativa]